MADKKSVGHAYNVDFLNVVFAASSLFLFLSVIGRLSGGRIDHPPVDDRPLPASRRALFWLVVLVFTAIFMPVPLRVVLGPGAP